MRIRFTIKTLLILTTLIGIVAGYYLSVHARVSAERHALSQLRDRGIEVTPMQYRPTQSFRESIDWPWHSYNQTEIPCCCGLHLEIKPSPSAKKKKSAAFGDSLKQLKNCSRLRWVTFHSPVTADEIRYLEDLPHLSDVDLTEAGVGESLVDSLLQLKHLNWIQFDKNQISKSSFHRFNDAGIEVYHFGLTDHRLAANFIEHDELFRSVDPEQTELTMRVGRFNGKYHTAYNLDLTSRADYYTADLEDVSLNCELDVLEGNLDSLVGQSQPMSSKGCSFEADNHFELRGGIDSVSEMTYEVVERKGSRVRIKGIFNLDDSTSAKIDAWFQVKVVVFLDNEDPIDELETALKEVGLDIDEFTNPVFEKRFNLYRLAFKSDAVKPK